ncbi:NAD(P)/FAD-dependent oxidoreductase [Peribacillus psychrosaccharolyticus]|uniref:NAD(P)/FAD-dependent oxidoreductase n=1 Tax=Peribacillus psychrosaccharolyticus TaxID=1407 RepID=UPI003D28C16F
MTKQDCLIIGGGIAGLQCAIQLGRYNHDVTVIDSEQGRSTITWGFHNLLGWPKGITGPELRKLGREHAEQCNVTFLKDRVVSVKKDSDIFIVKTAQNNTYEAKTIFIATGITDNLPKINNLMPCLGKSIYICPDCDGFEITNKNTAIIGGGNAGANMALTLTYWTHLLTFINHTKAPIDDKLMTELNKLKIPVINEAVTDILLDLDGQLTGIQLESGNIISCERGFTAFSGNKLNNELTTQLGVKHDQRNHVLADPRTKETNITGVWAGGDLLAHSEQVTISMGDGSQAAIWIHKRLMGIPRMPQ